MAYAVRGGLLSPPPLTQKGDNMTIAQFWLHYIGIRATLRVPIEYYARRYGVEADELESIFLLETQRSLHTYDPAIGPLTPWLRRVLRTTVAKLGRMRRLEQKYLTDIPDSNNDDDLDLDDIGFWGVVTEHHLDDELVAVVSDQMRRAFLSYVRYRAVTSCAYANGRRTRSAILKAMSALVERGERLTTRSIAAECGINFSTVARHLDQIRDELAAEYDELLTELEHATEIPLLHI